MHTSERLPALLAAYESRLALRHRVTELRGRLQRHVSLIQMQELAARKRVLRRLGFIGDPATTTTTTTGGGGGSAVLELKGRVACEISSADELVLTELLFEGVFNRLSPEQIAALLSCFVFDERGTEMPKLGPELAEALRTLQVSSFGCLISHEGGSKKIFSLVSLVLCECCGELQLGLSGWGQPGNCINVVITINEF